MQRIRGTCLSCRYNKHNVKGRKMCGHFYFKSNVATPLSSHFPDRELINFKMCKYAHAEQKAIGRRVQKVINAVMRFIYRACRRRILH